MRTLAIDTATSALSIGLWQDDMALAFVHQSIGRGHAERLVPAIATLPNGGWADRIVVGVGPGSFTGIRVGIAAARALALAWRAELVGLSTLSLVAAAAEGHDDGTPVVALVNGGHGEAFAQVHSTDPVAPAGPVAAVPFADLADWVGERAALGPTTLIEHLPNLRPADPDVARLPRVAPLAHLPVVASYGRGPDARPAPPR